MGKKSHKKRKRDEGQGFFGSGEIHGIFSDENNIKSETEEKPDMKTTYDPLSKVEKLMNKLKELNRSDVFTRKNRKVTRKKHLKRHRDENKENQFIDRNAYHEHCINNPVSDTLCTDDLYNDKDEEYIHQFRHQTTSILLDYQKMLNNYHRICKKQTKKHITSLRLNSICDSAIDSCHTKHKKSGDEIWLDIQETVKRIFPECWNVQWNIVQAMLRISIRSIYMEELDMCLNRLIQYNGLKYEDLVSFLVVLAPRRFGKTTAQAAVIATLMINIPHFSHVHYPLLAVMGDAFLSQIRGFIECSPKGVTMMNKFRHNNKLIQLQGPTHGDIRVSFYKAANANVSDFFLSFFCSMSFIVCLHEKSKYKEPCNTIINNNNNNKNIFKKFN